MKRKIICLVIVSLFLLTSTLIVSGLNIEKTNSNDLDETIFVYVYDKETGKPVSNARVKIIYGNFGKYEKTGRTFSTGLCILVGPFYQGPRNCAIINVNKYNYRYDSYNLYPDGFSEGELSDGGTVTIQFHLKKVESTPKIFEKQMQRFPLLFQLLKL